MVFYKKPAGPDHLKSLGFEPVHHCDAWRKKWFSRKVGRMVSVFVLDSDAVDDVERAMKGF